MLAGAVSAAAEMHQLLRLICLEVGQQVHFLCPIDHLFCDIAHRFINSLK